MTPVVQDAIGTARPTTAAAVGPSAPTVHKTWLTRALWVLPVLPLLFSAVLIARYAVDIPRYDELIVGSLLINADAGTLSFANLFAQANESRLVFPKLISLAIARSTHWDTRYAMWLTVGLILVNLLLLLRLYRRSPMRELLPASPYRDPLLLLGAAVMVYTPFQMELLWGFQYLVHIPMTCLLLALTVASSRWASSVKYLVAAILCFVATFSYANGMLLWPLAGIAVFMLSPRGRARWTWGLLFTLASMATIAWYFHGYITPAHHPKFTAALAHRLDSAAAFISFFGAPLSKFGDELQSLPGAIAVGACVLLVWGMVFAVVLRRGQALAGWVVPWAILFLYVLISGAVTTAGRIGFGRIALVQTRYAAFNTYAIAALFFAVPLAFAGLTKSSRPWRIASSAAVACLAIAFASLSAMTLPVEISYYRTFWHGGLGARAALPFAEQMPKPLIIPGFFPPADLSRQTRKLRKLGYLRPSAASQFTYTEGLSRPSAGWVDRIEKVDGNLLITGWAFMADRRRPGDAVIITTRKTGPDGTTLREPIAIAYPVEPRPDVALAVGKPAAEPSGWTAVVESPSVAIEGIEAWAADAETASLRPLHIAGRDKP